MCSRYSLTSPPEAVRRLFDLGEIEAFPPRANIAPTEPVSIVRNDPKGSRQLRLVRWGLIPPWVKDPRHFTTLINARSESAAEKPSFRGALRHRRCLVPASGFYEWSGPKGARQAHHITVIGTDVFALAGLWETWLGADGSELETMAILTTAANWDMTPIHDRMPVIVEPSDYERWLDCRGGDATPIEDVLRPICDGRLSFAAVAGRVNAPGAASEEKQQTLPF